MIKLNFLLSDRILLSIAFKAILFLMEDIIMDLIGAFLQQCSKTPNNIALKFESRCITYRQMDEMSSVLAYYLVNNGVKIGDNIALIMDRSIEMIIAMYAVLKSGAAFVPLDKSYPEERLKFIISDVNAMLIILDDDMNGDFSVSTLFTSGINDVILDDRGYGFENRATDDLLSYIIYTSGTTGHPKGVMVEHKNVQNCMDWMKKVLQITENDIFLQKTNYTFDVSMCEIFLPLQCGATLVIPRPDGQKDVEYLKDIISSQGVTMIFFVPSMLNLFLQDNHKCHIFLKKVICSGEKLTGATIKKFKKKYSSDVRIFNMYGPTETAVHVTFHECIDDSIENISIGVVPPMVEAYIVDKDNRCLPTEAEGELCIGGIQVSRGYWNNEKLTNEKFITLKKMDGQSVRVYKTGDLCQIEKSGEITYNGRIDTQVKLRGLRIELGEIETVIQEDNNIMDAAVILKKEAEEDFFVAFLVVTNKQQFNEMELRDRLAGKLPIYMLPRYYVLIDAIPVGVTGKRNSKALAKFEYLNRTEAKQMPFKTFSADENYIASVLSNQLNIRITEKDKGTFFWKLGLDSFSLIKMKRLIYETRNVDIPLVNIFANNTIEKLAKLLQTDSTCAETQPISCKMIPLEERFSNYVFIEKIKGNSCVYNLPTILKIIGTLDVVLLKKAAEYVLNNMRCLKLKVIETDRGYSFKYVENAIVVESLFESSNAEEYMEGIFSTPLDLSQGNLKAYVIETRDGILYLALNIHHIVTDGWSIEIICREILECYDILLDGNVIDRFFDDFNIYSAQKYINEEYWIEKFTDFSGPSEIISSKTRNKICNFMGESKSFCLDDRFYDYCNSWCRRMNCTPSILFMLTYIILISKYTNKKDITIGVPYNGRDNAVLYNAVGNFIKMVPIRQILSRNVSLEKLVVQLSKELQNAISHSDFSHKKVAGRLGLVRDASRNLLYQLGFAFQKFPEYKKNYKNFTVEIVDYHNHSSMMDMTLFVHELHDGKYRLEIEYSTDLYEEVFINRLIKNYLYILHQIIENPFTTVESIQGVCGEEREGIRDILDKMKRMQHLKNLDDVIEQQIKSKFNKSSVSTIDKRYTYQELNIRANVIAHELFCYGIGTNDRVCLYCRKDFDYVAAIVACIRLNAVFVPIDLSIPQRRVEFIILDSECKALLYDEKCPDKYKDKSINLETLDKAKGLHKFDNKDKTDQLYILYTSGSTGNPKGVLCKKSSVFNLLDDMDKRAENHPDKVVGSLWTSVSFDVSIYEIFSILVKGGELKIVPDSVRYISSDYFQWLYEEEVNYVYIPPSMLIDFSDYIFYGVDIPDLKRLLVGVEPITNNVLRKIANGIKGVDIFNGYGPTETTICSTMFKYEGEDNEERVPIGEALQNTALYILDDDLNIMPMSVPGELFISGMGVSMGYLNLEKENIELFLNNPYSVNETNSIMYKTGDIVKLINSAIVFEGREDSQIKLNGYKVNLNEISDVIKKTLYECSDVFIEVVDQKIIAFIKRKEMNKEKFDAVDIRKQLKNYLPLYMIPNKIFFVDEFPFTLSGKIDKQKLLNKFLEESYCCNQSNQIEKNEVTISRVIRIWEDVLGINVNNESLEANFFDLGGNSLLLIKTYKQIKKYFDIDITIIDLFEYSSLRELAIYIDEKQHFQPETETKVSIQDDGNRVNKLMNLRKRRNTGV